MPAKPVYALVGNEPYLHLWELRNILAEFKEGDVDRVDVDGERAGLSDVLDQLRSFAMFGGHKLVIVRDADKFISEYREPLENYLGNPSSSGTLVLRLNSLPKNQRIYKLVTKVGRVVECEPPNERALAGWIIKQAKSEHKLTIAPDAAALLAELIGADLGRLDSELAKLALMCDDNCVTADTIAHGVAFQREQEMWHLTDTLSSGDVAAALKRWRQLLQTDPSSEFRAVTWLTLWVQKLARARAMAAKKVPPFVIARELRIWPANNVDGVLRIANRLGDAGIKRALDGLVETDLRSKSGRGEFSTNVETFLLSLAD
jgi:DNA polymerase-3 subunit delta